MARKRMISPEIWESQNFSQLSDLAKIVFISLFSHADDEGRGRADTGYIKSMTFPYDENRRVADIKQALSEIALRMSVQFYSVNGSDYYFMTSWERWQKIDKPSKSKLPPPPSVGEGGDICSAEKFDEASANARRIFGEASATNRIEKNRIQKESKKEKIYKKEASSDEPPLRADGSYDIEAWERHRSHADIMDEMGVTGLYRETLENFLRYCYANGRVVMNEKLVDIVCRLQEWYEQDDASKIKSLERAMSAGYYDVKEK